LEPQNHRVREALDAQRARRTALERARTAPSPRAMNTTGRPLRLKAPQVGVLGSLPLHNAAVHDIGSLDS